MKDLISYNSLSERDIIQEKDNSVQNKSFYSTDLDLPDLVSKKDYFQIKLIKNENFIDLSSKSIKKIFSLISGEAHEILEDNYLDYITWLIGLGDELEKQQLITPNEKIDNEEKNLNPSYFELLSKTKIYYINIPKLNKYNQINKRIKLKNFSLNKISSFLGLDIYDISDFIEIFILSFTNKDNLENKKSIKSKLVEKFNDEYDKENNKIEDFNIIKKFELILKESEKCKKLNLENFEEYFEKVWNKIEEKNKEIENLNVSDSENDSEKNNEESSEENNQYIPNSYNINENYNNKNINKTNIELKEENACGENICANICEIF